LTKARKVPTNRDTRLAYRLAVRIPSPRRGRQLRRPPRQPRQRPTWPLADLEPSQQHAAENLWNLTPSARKDELPALLWELRSRGHDFTTIGGIVTLAWAKKYGMPEVVQGERDRVRFLEALRTVIDAARIYHGSRRNSKAAAMVLAVEPLINPASPLDELDSVVFPMTPAWTPKRRRGNTDTGWPEVMQQLKAVGIGGKLRARIKLLFAL